MSSLPDDHQWEHYNQYLRNTKHIVLFKKAKSWSDTIDQERGFTIDGGDTWSLIECCGCESVRLRHDHWFSEDMDEGHPIDHKEFFPPSVTRQKPIWRRRHLPMNLNVMQYDGLLDEIYGALAIGAHRLATMGIRALVEKLMIEQIGDRGSFDNNIAASFETGHIAKNQQTSFRKTLIEAGHAAMHRDFQPTADVVNCLLDIIEAIMNAIYYAPLQAESVKKTIPIRSRTARKNHGKERLSIS